jgi:hypothetical protein
MLRAFTFALTMATTMMQGGQHTWVGANLAASAVLSVDPGYGFSATERPEFAGGGGQAQIAQAPAAGGAIAISTRQVEGAQAVDVTGTAPPGTAVDIIAQARLSIDLPVVYLNEKHVVADTSGAFSVTIPIAPDYIPGTEVLILAQASGMQPGSASFVVGAPGSGPPIQSTDVDTSDNP